MQFTLGVKLLDRVVKLIVRATEARHLEVERLAPVTQAGAGFKAKTSAKVLILTAVEIELVTQHQTRAAAQGLVMETLGLQIALGVFAEDRNQRIFQVVVHRQHLIRA
ncbi:hypothetical protein D3C84_584010 [compost metagenome]